MLEENIEEAQSNALSIGSMLEEFEILSILGAGGFGITYKVKDTNLNKIMVIKEYMPNAFASRSNNTTVTCISKDRETFEWGLERFLDEARTLSSFDHISIVKAHRFFEANNTAYFVMDFYEGETLEDYLEKHPNKQFNQDEILSVMMPIIEGLKAVHNEGFLHRDIAPDNIFLRQTKPPILIDFGASRNALGVQSQNISAIVKHGYSPPEQYTSSSNQDETTDLYAISAVIYQMITSKKPPESTHRQTEAFNDDSDPIEDIEQKYKDRFAPSFLQTVAKGLSLRQKDRVQSIGEFQKGLVSEDEIDIVQNMTQNNKTVNMQTPTNKGNTLNVKTQKHTKQIENNTKVSKKSNILIYIIVGVVLIGTLIGGYTIQQKMAENDARLKAFEEKQHLAEVKRLEEKATADRLVKEAKEKEKIEKEKADRLAKEAKEAKEKREKEAKEKKEKLLKAENERLLKMLEEARIAKEEADRAREKELQRIEQEKRMEEERVRLEEEQKERERIQNTPTVPIGVVRGLDPNGDGFLSIRNRPKGRELGRLYNGDKVELYSKSGEWYKIRSVRTGQEGWSHGNWIRR